MTVQFGINYTQCILTVHLLKLKNYRNSLVRSDAGGKFTFNCRYL